MRVKNGTRTKSILVSFCFIKCYLRVKFFAYFFIKILSNVTISFWFEWFFVASFHTFFGQSCYFSTISGHSIGIFCCVYFFTFQAIFDQFCTRMDRDNFWPFGPRILEKISLPPVGEGHQQRLKTNYPHQVYRQSFKVTKVMMMTGPQVTCCAYS